MIVLDASVVVELILGRGEPELLNRVFEPNESLHAPAVLDVEVTQVIRRYWLGKQLSTTRADEALQDFQDLRLTRHSHGPLLQRIWELRQNLTAYDAAYVVLAEALSAPLLTRDGALIGVPGARAQVELV